MKTRPQNGSREASQIGIDDNRPTTLTRSESFVQGSPIVEPIPPERRDGVRYSESFNGKEIAEEWLAELRRRLARSAVLLDHGLPDHGFDLLAQEIHLFREVLHHAKEKK